MVIYGAGLTALLFRLAVSSGRWDVLHFNGDCRHFIYFE
jgi:hypothetical protein